MKTNHTQGKNTCKTHVRKDWHSVYREIFQNSIRKHKSTKNMSERLKRHLNKRQLWQMNTQNHPQHHLSLGKQKLKSNERLKKKKSNERQNQKQNPTATS